MEELLGEGIKKIIDQHLEVGTILEEYEIGCVPCNVGTCQLQDIVDIHNLSPESEQQMMTRIAKVVYPDGEISVPLRERKRAAKGGEIKYSPPMKRLVDEHVLIKRLVALIPSLIENMDLETESGRRVVLDAVDFIRSYADKYHHAKEEDILFKYFDENVDILKVMHEDHETARAHVRALLEAVEKREPEDAAEHLSGYRELLTEHIKKEDEILYPWMDRELTDSQIGQLFSQFHEVESTFGDDPADHEKLITKLEEAHR